MDDKSDERVTQGPFGDGETEKGAGSVRRLELSTRDRAGYTEEVILKQTPKGGEGGAMEGFREGCARQRTQPGQRPQGGAFVCLTVPCVFEGRRPVWLEWSD